MYTGQSGGNDFPQPFVAAKENGRWGKPKKLRGIPDTFIGDQISCPSAGNCFIYGTYEPNSATEDSYVVREMHGRWGRVTRLGVAINSLSCWSGGNCAGGGNSTTGPVVIAEKNGRWGKPENVPGIKRVKGDNPLFGGPTVATVTCSSAGDCDAEGSYVVGDAAAPFVVTEKNGRWQKAEEVPGIAALATHGGSGLGSLSCSSGGTCGAGGSYVSALSGASSVSEAFVVTERNHAWAKAEEVPGIAKLNIVFPDFGATAQVSSVSCRSAGNCSAGGSYTDKSFDLEAFAVTEKNGTWGNAEEVPGTAALNVKKNDSTGGLSLVACGSAGNCSGVGAYTDRSGNAQAFVVVQKKGTWARARAVAGILALESSGA